MTKSTKTESQIDGYNPLEGSLIGTAIQELVDLQRKRTVQNVLKSYTGTYDVFSEMLQNALDAIQARWSDAKAGKAKYQPKLWIELDIGQGRVRVTDNGVGMDIDEFKYCFAPFLSFKSADVTRGHKGVGATFLAYGYDFIRMESHQEGGEKLAAILRSGRQWASSPGNEVPPPTLESAPFSSSELNTEKSGTSIEILLSQTEGARPKDLNWLGATNAEQWLAVLRMKTPLGGIYLESPDYRPVTKITVTDAQGNSTDLETQACDYLYPHEFEGYRVQEIREIETALNKIKGDAKTKFQKLDTSLKRLDIIYDLWPREDLLSDEFPFNASLTADERQLIERYNVTVYFAFLSSAKMWGHINDEILKLRKGQRLLKGGLIMASDSMIQGEPIVIPLTSTIGYQVNSHVIVHFVGGDPDMGRKSFQPELTALAEELSVKCVKIAKSYISHVRPDTGASTASAKKELHDWIRAQEDHRDSRPFAFSTSTGEVCLISEPQQEQDVIALFHELLGLNVLRGYKFFATSQSDRYDSLFSMHYSSLNVIFDEKKLPLGVSLNTDLPFYSEPRVLEYKYDLDALIADFQKDLKAPDQIDLAVCWTASKKYKELYDLESYLIPGEGADRECFGATHGAYRQGNNQKDFEVIVLKDLLGYIDDPVKEAARQKTTYSAD